MKKLNIFGNGRERGSSSGREIKPEHKKILNTIRSAYEQGGAELLYKPEDFGLNPFEKSGDGSITVNFDYGVPMRLITPDGSYVILGSHSGGNASYEELIARLRENFDIEEVEPQRNDTEVRMRSEYEFQMHYSGPKIKLNPVKGK